MQLLYVMDPMCAWCYAFQPELEEFLEKHPSAAVNWIMGGLAPDANHPMDESLRQTISTYWHEIEQRSRVTFNHDFWKTNVAYRSTYPACRAVISAESMKPGCAPDMVQAIQSAYYKEARNPSLEETLLVCAESIGFNGNYFLQAFESEETEQRLQQHLAFAQQLRVRGFPALFFVNDRNLATPLALGYTRSAQLQQQFNKSQGE